ncbi:unnamed protein product [Polarella glacialis]|uniref:Uncharacterized protein n=1 Tax=Polarella glacialis TaxID=89957 RepID=A0A813FUD8_POLGL|nr:unnamed protein product [Polarella glacialis]
MSFTPSQQEALSAALRRRSADLTSSELLEVVTALQRLGAAPDGELLQRLHSRSLAVGPFDAEGAPELMRRLGLIGQRLPWTGPNKSRDASSESALQEMAVGYGLTAALHGSGSATALSRTAAFQRLVLAPRPGPSQLDARFDRLLSARRTAWAS